MTTSSIKRLSLETAPGIETVELNTPVEVSQDKGLHKAFPHETWESYLSPTDRSGAVSFEPRLDPPTLPPNQKLNQSIDQMIATLEKRESAAAGRLEAIANFAARIQMNGQEGRAEFFHNMMADYQEIKKNRQKTLIDAKERFAHDQQVAQYFSYSQAIAGTVGFLCTIAAVLSGAGVVAVPAIIAETAPVASAVTAALSAGGKSYFQIRGKEEDKSIQSLSHDQQRFDQLIKDYLKEISACVEAYNDLHSSIMEIAKNKNQIASLIIR